MTRGGRKRTCYGFDGGGTPAVGWEEGWDEKGKETSEDAKATSNKIATETNDTQCTTNKTKMLLHLNSRKVAN